MASDTELQDKFVAIYDNNAWLSGSGTGSLSENNLEYITFISRFMLLNEVKSVVDFGCGDWQFSRFVDWSRVDYTGIDIVPSVVKLNTEKFSNKNIKFKCDSALENVPYADLLLCKDVLQHLPNEFVDRFLSVVERRFKYALITNDDLPNQGLNANIAAGQWRALRLDKPPFSRKCVSLLSWVVISNTPTVRKRTVLLTPTLTD